MDKKIQDIEIYQKLVDSIGITIENSRQRAIQAVNNELLKANWEIGNILSNMSKMATKKQNMAVHY